MFTDDNNKTKAVESQGRLLGRLSLNSASLAQSMKDLVSKNKAENKWEPDGNH